ncbi:glycosyltransferase family 4 protein [Methanobrevibacter acididurans]|uniref:glycosyltransferase family 4 protein n=1 Tax=Methanobrevibacter acididurans TaxID=120963 RepID=UPI0038FCD8D7
MKIAMVGQFPPHIGGVGVHIHTLSKELVKQGHEVYVITYPHKDIKDIDGIHVIGTKGINIPGLRGLLFGINAQKCLNKLVHEKNIDIIHGHYLFPAGYAATKVGKKNNITTYVTAHGSDMFELYAKHFLIHPIIKKVLKNADHILAVSQALKKEIIKTNIKGLENKISINWNSVDTERFKPNNDYNFKDELKNDYNVNINKPIILFVGNIIKRKNVKTLIEAKNKLNNDSTLVIVGNGPLLNSLKEYVKKEDIKDVIFLGAREDIEKIIPSCDMLVLPSYSESFGLVLIEALACGKPIIGSDVGGIREIITKDVGLLINPNSSDDLSEKIDLLLNDKDLYDKFASNARNRSFDFSKVEIPYKELN